MSLVEEAREVRERIAARLRELEPLVAEYHELQKVAVEMGIDATDPPSAPAATAQAPRRQRPRIASENDESAQRVREAVRDQPGKTVADYAGLLSLSPAPLYRPTRELTAAGVIVKRGRQLFPA